MALFQYTGHMGLAVNALFMFMAGACNCGVDPYLTGSIPAEIGERENVFTDHTLAHPLNCRGGVVARLSA